MNGGADLGDFISKLTENPETMKTLMSVAGNLMNKPDQKEDAAESYEQPKMPPAERDILPVGSRSKDDDDGYKQHKKGEDAENLIRLLVALKPYVSSSRRGKIDSIIKILKLIALSEKSGLLRSLL